MPSSVNAPALTGAMTKTEERRAFEAPVIPGDERFEASGKGSSYQISETIQPTVRDRTIVNDCPPSPVERQRITEGDQHFTPISPDSPPSSTNLPHGALSSETRDVLEVKERDGGDHRENACPELQSGSEEGTTQKIKTRLTRNQRDGLARRRWSARASWQRAARKRS